MVCGIGTAAIPSVDPLRHVRQPPFAREGRLPRITSRAEWRTKNKVEVSLIQMRHILTQLRPNLYMLDNGVITFPTFRYIFYCSTFSDRPFSVGFLTRTVVKYWFTWADRGRRSACCAPAGRSCGTRGRRRRRIRTSQTLYHIPILPET